MNFHFYFHIQRATTISVNLDVAGGLECDASFPKFFLGWCPRTGKGNGQNSDSGSKNSENKKVQQSDRVNPLTFT